MNSPFTDFTGIENENGVTAFGGKSLYGELPRDESMETGEADSSLQELSPFSAEGPFGFETEISDSALKSAVDLNRRYMIEYGWQQYAKDILRTMGITNDSWITNSAEENLRFFTKQFADWQDKNGFKTTAKGVFGINNWTYVQKKLGFHNLSNRYNIDVSRALSNNRVHEKNLWGTERTNMFQYFQNNNIVKVALPLNDEYLAYAVADFQALKKLKIDGILGPITWGALKGISVVPTTPNTTGTGTTRSRWHQYITGTKLCKAEPLIYGKNNQQPGKGAYDQIVKAIRSAEGPGSFIYILGWMLDVNFPLIPNDPESVLSKLLAAASDRSVQIRILIWDNPFFQKEILKSEIKINPLKNALLLRDTVTRGSVVMQQALSDLRRYIAAVPITIKSMLDDNETWKKLNNFSILPNETAHHEKVIIVKGKNGLVGFCGGLDINPDRIGAYEGDRPIPIKGFNDQGIPIRVLTGLEPMEIWHDAHCRLEGFGAWSLLQRFLWRWDQFVAAKGYVNDKMKELLIGRDVKEPSSISAGPGVSNVKIINTYNQAGGNIVDRSVFETVKTVINNAETSIHFEDQYMISVDIAKLINNRFRAKNGKLKVTILTHDDYYANQDLYIVNRLRKEFLDTLYDGISRDNENITVFMLDRKKPFPARHYVHSKMYIIDGELAIIGSANCNRRSMTSDSETAFIFFQDNKSTELVGEIQKQYEHGYDWIRYAPNPEIKDIDDKMRDMINELPGKLALLNPTLGGAALVALSQVAPALFQFASILPSLVRQIVDPYMPTTLPDNEVSGESPVDEFASLSPFSNEADELPIYSFGTSSETNPDMELSDSETLNFYESSDEETANLAGLMPEDREESLDNESGPELFSDFVVDPSKGTTGYLNVSAVKGLSLKTGVFVPASFTKTSKVNIIVYLHGLFGNGSNSSGVDSYWNTYSNIRDYFYTSNRNGLLLVPGLSSDPQSSNVLLNQPGGFDNFLDACLAALKTLGHIDPAADFDQVIIAAHSAGGKPLSFILGSSSKYLPKVVECWGFDCLYADGWASPISKWATGSKIFYHYWAWSCSAKHLNKCPRVIGDKFQKTNPSNFKNIAPVGKIGHQQVIEHAWLNQINTRLWFGAGAAIVPAPTPTPAPAPAPPSSGAAAMHAKMGLAQLGLSLDAFTIACNGYRKLDQSGQLKNNRILSIADFTQSSKKRRLYILDMVSQTVLINTNVAHGHNGTAEWATKFSNTPGSHMSSLGFYLTQETYHGSKNGLSLRLKGLEKGFNDNARPRAIVVHSASYVHEDGPVGRSWGCPVVPPSRRDEVINTIKEGTCLFLYFNDPDYLSKSLLASAGTGVTNEVDGLDGMRLNEDFESIYETIVADSEQMDELQENFDEETNALPLMDNEAEPVDVSPVPFAPLPPARSYWPLVTNVREGRLVSYTGVDGKTVGSDGRKFNANRTTTSGAGRHHVAIDLYANFNDPVIAVDDGKILGFKHFYDSSGGHATNSLVVQHSNVIVNYGEVGPSSFPRLGLKVGDTVKAGQVIAYVGATGMLHFETYKITDSATNPPFRWMKADAQPPASLYNPTKYLLYLKEHGLIGSGQPTTIPPGTTPPVTTPPPGNTAPGTQWTNAVRLNRHYQDTLGWAQYYDKINDLLLPFSGLQNVSLGEEAFAAAVAGWQKSQGFTAKDCDGIIGPNTWAKMKGSIVASSPTPPVTTPPPAGGRSLEAPPAAYSTDKVPAGFKQGSYSGWQGLDRKSTLRVDEAAKRINADGSLTRAGITEIDIDTFQRIASAETGGKIQNFYSYDMAIVSIGFRQNTFIHGNIHDWINKAPAAFSKYGIEIDDSVPPYSIKRSKGAYTVKRIKGVTDPESMRWNGWAQRFYYAGLDYDVIIAEFLLAKEYFARELGRVKTFLKSSPDKYQWFTNYYNQSGHLRAFFHELNNAAPAWVPPIVAEALGKSGAGQTPAQFHAIFYDTAKLRWKNEVAQVERIYTNTAKGSTIKVFDQETMYEEPAYEDVAGELDDESIESFGEDQFADEAVDFFNETDNFFENDIPVITQSESRKRIDEYFTNAAYEYRLDTGKLLKVYPQFRLTNGKPILSASAVRKIIRALKDLKSKCPVSSSTIQLATMGRARPSDVGLITQCLIDAGQLALLRKVKLYFPYNDAQLVRLLQTLFGIGLDCAGYVQQAFIYMALDTDTIKAGRRIPLGLLQKITSERLYGLRSDKYFTVVDFRDAQTGDLIVMHEKAKDPGSIHTVIVVEHTHAGDLHRFLVDSSWGHLYGDDFAGVARREWCYDDASKLYWDIDPSTGKQANANKIGFYDEHPLKGVYRARQSSSGITHEFDDEDASGSQHESNDPVNAEESLNMSMDNYAPEFENYSLSYRLDKVADWSYLLGYKVSDDIVSSLRTRSMFVQYAHNESYSNDLNADFYRLRILKYPVLNGATLTASQLIKYIRLNINKLVDTSYCDFYPYSQVIDAPVWNSDNPTGAVLKLDIKGPDNASVVVSLAKPTGWRFSTIHTPDTGDHPVSGHREFFIGTDPATSGTYFVIKGLDMMSSGIAGLGAPVAGEWGFGQADSLWKSMRSKIIQFINSNGGSATEDMTYSERVEWRYVYYRYKNLLEQVFGKGAGSAENSPFFDFQLAT